MQLSELKKGMKGVQVVQMTPFNKDGSLDLEGMRANTRWLAEYADGKDFIFTPVGSNGEFYAMSDDERKAAIKAVVEETAGRAVVMAGCAHAGTRETIKSCQAAESVGADGALVVLPYYHCPKDEGLYQHYKQICEGVGPNFGIQLYNNIMVSGSWAKPEVVARLSKIPNFIAVKENTPSITAFYQMQKALDPKDTVVLCGMGDPMYIFESVYGATGFITERANFAPALSYSLYEAAVARDFIKVGEVFDSMMPYFNFIRKVEANHGPNAGITNVTGYMAMGVAKASMDIVGLRGGEMRLPLLGITEEEKAELKGVLRAIKVIK